MSGADDLTCGVDDPRNRQQQEWILRHLSDVGKLCVGDLMDRLDWSRTTSRWNLTDLRRQSRIDFVGPPQTCHWQLRRA